MSDKKDSKTDNKTALQEHLINIDLAMGIALKILQILDFCDRTGFSGAGFS